MIAYTDDTNSRRTKWLLPCLCFLTVIAQTNELLSSFTNIAWVMLLFFSMMLSAKTVRIRGNIRNSILLIFGCVLLCCCFFLVTGELSYITGLLLMVMKSSAIYLVGVLYYEDGIRDKDAIALVCAYLAASLFYAVWVISRYYSNLSAWYANNMYAFGSKNSFGQIVAVAIIVSLLMRHELCGKSSRLLILGSAMFLFITMLLFQCRTAILATCFVLLLYLLRNNKQKSIRVFLVAVFGIILMSIPQAKSFLTHAFLLDKYEVADTNSLTSGRLGFYAQAITAVMASNRELIGIPPYYVDNFYLNTFMNVGFLGSTALFLHWFYRVGIGCVYGRSCSGKNWYIEAVYWLTMFYIVESLSEGLPPYGPGTSSFLFWLLSGAADHARDGQKTGINSSSNVDVAKVIP